MFKIGNIKVKTPLFLAPMAGITDTTFRSLCKKMGAEIVYTEFVSANGIIRENKKTLDMMKFSEEERPIGVQIFGDDAEILGHSAKIIKDRFSPDLIDINFGCPVPKITNKGAGSGAMKNMTLMIKMAENVIKNAENIPVTVKMRAGWSQDKIISKKAGIELEKIGIKAITLHPRTSNQKFTGRADWSLIRELKDSVQIPIIGNGDIQKPEDYQKMIHETNCDAVMIARSALGNPWIFKQIKSIIYKNKYDEISLENRVRLCNEHYMLLKKDKSEQHCLNLTKKHYSWYLKNFPNASFWRIKFMKSHSLDEIEENLKDLNAEYGINI